jgi:hypothetical protein
MRRGPGLGGALCARRAQERSVKSGRAVGRLAGRVHGLVGVRMQRVKQTLQGCARRCRTRDGWTTLDKGSTR